MSAKQQLERERIGNFQIIEDLNHQIQGFREACDKAEQRVEQLEAVLRERIHECCGLSLSVENCCYSCRACHADLNPEGQEAGDE